MNVALPSSAEKRSPRRRGPAASRSPQVAGAEPNWQLVPHLRYSDADCLG